MWVHAWVAILSVAAPRLPNFLIHPERAASVKNGCLGVERRASQRVRLLVLYVTRNLCRAHGRNCEQTLELAVCQPPHITPPNVFPLPPNLLGVSSRVRWRHPYQRGLYRNILQLHFPPTKHSWEDSRESCEFIRNSP